MAIFKITDSDVGITFDGVSYEFETDDITVNDPEVKSLTRGANSEDEEGIVFTEGLKEPKEVTAIVSNVPGSLFELMETIYKDEERIDFYVIDRKTGTSRIAKSAILKQLPRQLKIAEGADSMTVEIKINTFSLKDKHKA